MAVNPLCLWVILHKLAMKSIISSAHSSLAASKQYKTDYLTLPNATKTRTCPLNHCCAPRYSPLTRCPVLQQRVQQLSVYPWWTQQLFCFLWNQNNNQPKQRKTPPLLLVLLLLSAVTVRSDPSRSTHGGSVCRSAAAAAAAAARAQCVWYWHRQSPVCCSAGRADSLLQVEDQGR